LNEWIIVHWRVTFAITIPQGSTDPPAVFDGDEMVCILTLRRTYARSAGKTGWREEEGSEKGARFWPGSFGFRQGVLGGIEGLKAFGFLGSQIRRIVAQGLFLRGRFRLKTFEITLL
jgi:hypothetical protein